MGWERGKYYTRSRKVKGRVVREYVGGGEVGELIARIDLLAREERESEAADRRAARAELESTSAKISDLGRLCDLLARAALFAAGYRQHNRGEWRKQRGTQTASAPAPESRPGAGEPGRPGSPDRGRNPQLA